MSTVIELITEEVKDSITTDCDESEEKIDKPEESPEIKSDSRTNKFIPGINFGLGYCSFYKR